MLGYCSTSACAVTEPTWRTPRANSTLAKGRSWTPRWRPAPCRRAWLRRARARRPRPCALASEPRQGDDLAGLETHEVLALEAVQVGDVADQPLLVEQHDRLLADALDVHGALADEVLDALHELRRARAVGTAHGDLTGLAHGLGAAGRADVGHRPLGQGEVPLLAAHPPPFGVVGLPGRHGTDDLRDDVAGALQDHVVAGPDVLAPDVVLVVQRRALHGDASDEHRLEHGEGREHAGPPHVDLDAVQPGRHRGRRELEGDRPAGIVRDAPQGALEDERVDLDHGAVDVVVEVAAALLPGAARRGRPARCRPRSRSAG